MSHGPNFVALSQIKSPNSIPTYEQPSTNNNMQELERILQNNRQFEEVMKNLRKQFDHLGDTSTHITEFYPELITDNYYVQDYEKTVIYDQGMAELMFKLEKENQELKIELKVWMQQFGKKASLAQLLVKTNKALQEQIIMQDRDLVKVIDTLGNKQTEEFKDLEDRMNELKVENGLAVQHLYKIQEEIQIKKGYLLDANKTLEEHSMLLNETRQKLAETAEEEDHQTKTYALVKTIVDNLNLTLSQLNNRQRELEKENKSLKVDKDELTFHLNYNKDEIGDMQSKVINQNNQKIHEEKMLRRSIGSLEEKIKYDDDKIKKLENQLARQQRMVEHYVKAFNDSDIKLKNATQYHKSIEANLTKQLQKETQRGADVLTLKYQISVLEEDLEMVKTQRKHQETEFPEKVKRITSDFETQKKKLEKQLQELDLQHTRSLMSLNNQIVRHKAELERAQKDLQEKNQDLKDARNEQSEIKIMKASIRQLGALLRQKVAKVNALQ